MALLEREKFTALVPKHIFGLRGDVKDNVHFLDETTVLYPAGHNIVLYSTDTKTQRFLPCTTESDGITAVALSKSKKYLAVAEKGERAIITIYNIQEMKRRKVLLSSEAGSPEYVQLCFSPDEKYIIAQGGYPEWNAVLWLWEKSKVVFSVRTSNQQGSPVYQAVFHPNPELDIVTVVGAGIFKSFKIVEGNMKAQANALAKRDPQNYTCQAWAVDGDKERLLVGTDAGEVLVIEGGELRATLPVGDGHSVESILPFSKGFLLGASAGGMSVFEKQDNDKEPYRKSRTFFVPGAGSPGCRVRNLTLSPNEDTLLCSTDGNQLYQISLANQELLKAEELTLDLLSSPFHSAAVVGLDACVRRCLVATCSSDHTVRLWNYQDRVCELTKVFSEEPHSVAMHPSGYMLLVGFADKLRLMTVLMDDLRTVKEIGIKACKEARFSHGGQYFAAVNGNTIQVYSTYTCNNVGNLRGHNGRVTSVQWSTDDTRIVSAGVDGAVYEWQLEDLKRAKENVLKGCQYTMALPGGAPGEGRGILAVGSDRRLKEIGDESTVDKEVDTSDLVTQLAFPTGCRTLLAGTERGAIRGYRYPLSGEAPQEARFFAGPVSRMVLAAQETALFVASEDGSLFMFDVKDKQALLQQQQQGDRKREDIPYADEVLVTKSDLEERAQHMADLEAKVNELQLQNEYQLRLKELNMSERIKELTDKYTAELEADRVKFELLLQEKNRMEAEYEEKLKQAEERHGQQLSTLEAQFQAKLMVEVDRYQSLVQEKERLNEQWDEANAMLMESHEKAIEDLVKEYEARLEEEQMTSERLQQEKTDQENEFKEIRRQIEEDTDREIEELKEKYEARLAAERQVSLQLKGENGIMKKNFNALKKEIEEQKEEIKQLFDQKKELYQTIQSLEKDIVGLKKEIRERDDTIGDKEKRIYELKKKNQELEKFKFVLDYKIKELKKQIEPREREISDMKEQIKEMDHELERYHASNSALNLTISEMKLRSQGLQREVVDQRQARLDAVNYIRQFRHDLHEVVQHVLDPKDLKESVKGLYQKHIGTAEVEREEVDADIHSEYQRQRDYLEKTVDQLRRKLKQEGDKSKKEYTRVMQENVALIKEISELRREVKGLRAQFGAERAGPGAAPPPGGKSSPTGLSRQTSRAAVPGSDLQLSQQVEMQRELISTLRQQLAAKDDEVSRLAQSASLRPSLSRERLPPVGGDIRPRVGFEAAPAAPAAAPAPPPVALPSPSPSSSLEIVAHSAGLPSPTRPSAGSRSRQQSLVKDSVDAASPAEAAEAEAVGQEEAPAEGGPGDEGGEGEGEFPPGEPDEGEEFDGEGDVAYVGEGGEYEGEAEGEEAPEDGEEPQDE